MVNSADPHLGSLARSQAGGLSTFHPKMHGLQVPTSPSVWFPFMFYPVVGQRINIRRKTTLPILLVGLVLLAGCKDEPSPAEPNPAPERSSPNVGGASGKRRVPTFDEHLAELAGRIPGFGGYFIDRDGKIAIYLTNPAQRG